MYEELKEYIINLDYRRFSISELEKYTQIVIMLKKADMELKEHDRIDESLKKIENLLKGVS